MVDWNAIQEAHTHIDVVLQSYFFKKFIPKMNFLEDHVVPWMQQWMQQWKCGMAFHGEQAVESLHCEFSKLQPEACGIKSKTSQLLSMMQSRHFKCSLLIHAHMIPTEKRRV